MTNGIYINVYKETQAALDKIMSDDIQPIEAIQFGFGITEDEAFTYMVTDKELASKLRAEIIEFLLKKKEDIKKQL